MGADTALNYPAVFHHRIIVESGRCGADELNAVLAAFKVVEPLAESNRSASGGYCGYSVAIEMRDQAELHAFDKAVKEIPGVRMVL